MSFSPCAGPLTLSPNARHIALLATAPGRSWADTTIDLSEIDSRGESQMSRHAVRRDVARLPR